LFFGVVLNEKRTKLQFLIIFLGVNMTFFPQHFLGLNGIPRRYADYPDAFLFWNMISSLGSLLSLIGVLMFVYIVWESLIMRFSFYDRYYIGSSLE